MGGNDGAVAEDELANGELAGLAAASARPRQKYQMPSPPTATAAATAASREEEEGEVVLLRDELDEWLPDMAAPLAPCEDESRGEGGAVRWMRWNESRAFASTIKNFAGIFRNFASSGCRGAPAQKKIPPSESGRSTRLLNTEPHLAPPSVAAMATCASLSAPSLL